jgi:hypothetical protein
MDRNQLILLRQRAALLRAIARAREANAIPSEIETLQSIVRLLENFHDLLPRIIDDTKH